MRATVILAACAMVAGNAVFVMPQAWGHEDPDGVSPAELSDRFVPRPAGIEHEMSFLYGPFTIPPGQDNNRVTLDVPVHGGFLTSVQANLYDAFDGETPSNQHMHIHHAHWFRTSDDANDEYYTLNLAWVFGTGEERTKGDLNLRTAAEPGGPSYGIFIEPGVPQALIYMLHNKNSVVRTVYVALDVRFVSGTGEQIAAAAGCDPGAMVEGDACRAGEDFHHLYGKLWGTTFDVPRDWTGDGLYTHPVDIPGGASERRDTDALGRYWTVAYDAVSIGTAGHLHPNGRAVVIANLGPAPPPCEPAEGEEECDPLPDTCAADLDGDGLPGTTLARSDKIEMNPDAWPHSEEYQMGATHPAWRVGVHAGDRITQFGLYDNGAYASYEAMSYAGFYMDRLQQPAPFDAAWCAADPSAARAALGPHLIGGATGDPTVTGLNHAYDDHSNGYCGVPGFAACGTPVDPETLPEGGVVDAIHMADFVYMPGDQSLTGPFAGVPRVVQGTPLRIVNEDVAVYVRHTLTTCAWPCNGDYVANYPQPDGRIDTGKLGNLDYIDGGAVQPSEATPPQDWPSKELSPVYTLDTSTLEPGHYSFYCRIHPWMRGWFEVV